MSVKHRQNVWVPQTTQRKCGQYFPLIFQFCTTDGTCFCQLLEQALGVVPFLDPPTLIELVTWVA